MWSEFVDGTNLIQRSWCGSRVTALSHASYKHSLCLGPPLTLSSSHLLTFTWSPLTLSFIPHPLIHPSPSHPVTLSSSSPLALSSPHPHTLPSPLPSSSSPHPIIFIHSSYHECTCIHSPLAPSASSSPSFPLPYTGLAVVQWERGCGVRRT